MVYTSPFLLIAASILAISGLILSKKPDAKEMIDKLVPYQGFIGVALLAFGLLNLLRGMSALSFLFKFAPVWGILTVGMLISSILLGFMFGLPLIVKYTGKGGEKGAELSKKLAPFQVILGVIGLVTAVGFLLATWGILPVM